MKTLDISALENRTYSTSAEEIKKKFNGNLTHHSHMRFVLNTLGLKEQATQLVNYNKLFSKEVIAFMENYLVAEKYKVEVKIRISQAKVRWEVDDDKNPNRVFPPKDTIYIWLVSEDFVNYDTSFIKVQLGNNVAADFNKKEITLSYLEDFILDAIKNELLLNIYSKAIVDEATSLGLSASLMSNYIEKDINGDPVLKAVFKKSPALYIGIKAADFTTQNIEKFKVKENRWNPHVKDFKPLISANTRDNALICGIYNGLVQQAKAIPELAKLVSTFIGSPEEWEKFKEAIVKLFSDEEFQKAIIDLITKDYKDSIRTGNIEKFLYRLAYDTVTVVSILIGLYGLGKGVVSFVKFIRRAFLYVRRYGIKSVAKLKNLKPKQIERVLDDLEDQRPVRLSLKTKKMNPHYIGEETGVNSWCAPKKVKYLNELERVNYKLAIKDGKFFESNGKLFDTSNAGTVFSGKGKAIFVMDDNGFIYASKYQEAQVFHHSSLLAGKPVSGAGELKVTNGIIKEISRKSGHYTPSKNINAQVIKVLREKGVKTEDILITDGF